MIEDIKIDLLREKQVDHENGAFDGYGGSSGCVCEGCIGGRQEHLRKKGISFVRLMPGEEKCECKPFDPHGKDTCCFDERSEKRSQMFGHDGWDYKVGCTCVRCEDSPLRSQSESQEKRQRVADLELCDYARPVTTTVQMDFVERPCEAVVTQEPDAWDSWRIDHEAALLGATRHLFLTTFREQPHCPYGGGRPAVTVKDDWHLVLTCHQCATKLEAAEKAE